jgi:hypothetical protein
MGVETLLQSHFTCYVVLMVLAVFGINFAHVLCHDFIMNEVEGSRHERLQTCSLIKVNQERVIKMLGDSIPN